MWLRSEPRNFQREYWRRNFYIRFKIPKHFLAIIWRHRKVPRTIGKQSRTPQTVPVKKPSATCFILRLCGSRDLDERRDLCRYHRSKQRGEVFQFGADASGQCGSFLGHLDFGFIGLLSGKRGYDRISGRGRKGVVGTELWDCEYHVWLSDYG